MKTQRHPVDLRYTKEELLTLFAIATKEDVDLGGHYNCQGGAIHVWSHPWNNAAARYDSSTIGAFYGHCQVVGDNMVTKQQKVLSGRDCHRPNA